MNEYRQNMEKATIFFIINRHKIDGKFSLIRGLDSGSGSIFLYPDPVSKKKHGSESGSSLSREVGSVGSVSGHYHSLLT